MNDADVEQVVTFLSQTESVVRHNARAWLIRRFGNKNRDELEEIFTKAALPKLYQRAFFHVLTKHQENKAKGGFDSYAFSLSAYIPNLDEFEKLERYRKKLFTVFWQLDQDGDELLGADDVLGFLKKIGGNVSRDDVVKMIQEVDDDEDGKIDLCQWFDMMRGKLQMS